MEIYIYMYMINYIYYNQKKMHNVQETWPSYYCVQWTFKGEAAFSVSGFPRLEFSQVNHRQVCELSFPRWQNSDNSASPIGFLPGLSDTSLERASRTVLVSSKSSTDGLTVTVIKEGLGFLKRKIGCRAAWEGSFCSHSSPRGGLQCDAQKRRVECRRPRFSSGCRA